IRAGRLRAPAPAAWRPAPRRRTGLRRRLRKPAPPFPRDTATAARRRARTGSRETRARGASRWLKLGPIATLSGSIRATARSGRYNTIRARDRRRPPENASRLMTEGPLPTYRDPGAAIQRGDEPVDALKPTVQP